MGDAGYREGVGVAPVQVLLTANVRRANWCPCLVEFDKKYFHPESKEVERKIPYHKRPHSFPCNLSSDYIVDRVLLTYDGARAKPCGGLAEATPVSVVVQCNVKWNVDRHSPMTEGPTVVDDVVEGEEVHWQTPAPPHGCALFNLRIRNRRAVVWDASAFMETAQTTVTSFEFVPISPDTDLEYFAPHMDDLIKALPVDTNELNTTASAIRAGILSKGKSISKRFPRSCKGQSIPDAVRAHFWSGIEKAEQKVTDTLSASIRPMVSGRRIKPIWLTHLSSTLAELIRRWMTKDIESDPVTIAGDGPSSDRHNPHVGRRERLRVHISAGAGEGPATRPAGRPRPRP